MYFFVQLVFGLICLAISLRFIDVMICRRYSVWYSDGLHIKPSRQSVDIFSVFPTFFFRSCALWLKDAYLCCRKGQRSAILSNAPRHILSQSDNSWSQRVKYATYHRHSSGGVQLHRFMNKEKDQHLDLLILISTSYTAWTWSALRTYLCINTWAYFPQSLFISIETKNKTSFVNIIHLHIHTCMPTTTKADENQSLLKYLQEQTFLLHKEISLKYRTTPISQMRSVILVKDKVANK